MAVTLLHKFNSTAGSVPTASTVKVRELAINTADGVLYTQKSNGQVVAINPVFGPVPLAVTLDMGSIPTSAATFTVTLPGVTVGMNINCDFSGTGANGAYPDEFEMEPMGVYAMVTAPNTIFFSLSCSESSMLTVGKKTVIFYAG